MNTAHGCISVYICAKVHSQVVEDDIVYVGTANSTRWQACHTSGFLSWSQPPASAIWGGKSVERHPVTFWNRNIVTCPSLVAPTRRKYPGQRGGKVVPPCDGVWPEILRVERYCSCLERLMATKIQGSANVLTEIIPRPLCRGWIIHWDGEHWRCEHPRALGRLDSNSLT